MKSIMTFLALVFLSGLACSSVNVPDKVTSAFYNKFKTAEKIEWGKESDTEFEAEFVMDGKKMSANFDANGNWLESETVIKTGDLPAAVQSTLQSQFQDSEIEIAEMSEKSEGPVLYEIELEQGEKDMEIVLDAGGAIIKKEIKTEEHESEDND